MQLVEVDTEPAPFALLVTGVPGSGKTTLARRLAERMERAAHIPADVLGGFVASGRAFPAEPDPGGARDAAVDEADRQLLLRARNAALLADSFFQAGFVPVLDDVVVRTLQLDHYLGLLGARPLGLVVVAPPSEVVLARDARRDPPDKRGLAPQWMFLAGTLASELTGTGLWITADETPDASADAVLAAARDASGPLWVAGATPAAGRG